MRIPLAFTIALFSLALHAESTAPDLKRLDQATARDRELSSVQQALYLKLGQKKRILPFGSQSEFSSYLERCALRIAAYGTVNYPDSAKGKLYGTGSFTAEISKSGTLVKIDLLRSSGEKVLDDAILEAVMLAAPFPAFPPELASQWDSVVVAQPFSFAHINDDDVKQPAAK